jgi:hypothetical protein
MQPSDIDNRRRTRGGLGTPAVRQVQEIVLVHGFGQVTDRELGLPGEQVTREGPWFGCFIAQRSVPLPGTEI